MKKYIALSICATIAFTSCLNNDFMDEYPKDQQTEETVFTSYENFRTYTWGLYNVFFGYAYKTGQTDEIFRGDYEADNMIKHVFGNESQWAYQTAKVPASSKSWDYEYIRKVNLMLDNIDGSALTEKNKAHWRSVGYFFRAYKYFEMMELYGDIPWIEHVLTDESPELYAPRDSRDLVASNILANLKYAETNIKPEGDGDNTINKAVVQSLISRFTLFEGTWRKYHALKDADKYLEECVRASAEVMTVYPTLHNRYEELFNSESLSGVAGIILYKEYAANQMCHGLTRLVRTAESQIEATKDAVDCYLCSDGKPISTSTKYDGDKNVYDQFRNRDYRLYHTVCPPYKVKTATSSSPIWEYTENEADREFIDLMAKISSETFHQLPASNFRGYVTKGQPHFKNVNWGQGWHASHMGFWVWKYYNTHTNASTATGVCTTDAPLFRIGEILLNYAEAKYELQSFDQDAADISINKLRERAGVAPMVISEIDESFDLKRDPSVAPVLWEIRRERRVEMMGEGVRLKDLKRWKKGEYVNNRAVGVYLKDASEFKVKVTGGPSDNEGYVYYFDKPLGWQAHYYLNPLPLNQLVLNPQLKQNDGWK